MMQAPWRITLFGRLTLQQGDQTVTRFRTYKAGALLAFLAYFPHRSHTREELIELLWPEGDIDAGRNLLRVTLTSLRHRLEPPGVTAGSVLVADRTTVQLHPDAFTTDAAEFMRELEAARRADTDAATAERLERAVALYGDALLIGYDEDWIEAERARLAQAHLDALRRLVRCAGQARELERAIEFARRAVAADPLREETQRDLIRLYLAIGRTTDARQQYAELVRLLKETLGVAPSAQTARLVEQLGPLKDPGTAEQPAVFVAPNRRAPAAASAPVAQEPPPVAPARPSNIHLPILFTRFFGRQTEIARIAELLVSVSQSSDECTAQKPMRSADHEEAFLSASRLVTLTGPGGSGKTRLAIESANRLREAFSGGIWFVPLANAAEPRQIPDALLNALSAPRATDADPWEQVIAFLNGRGAEPAAGPQRSGPLLLVLDNFEHLALDGAVELLPLCERVPGLSLLVTSRRRLRLPGERELRVMPLPTPVGEEAPEQLTQVASVRMFVDRAQAARPDFQITPRNAAAIAALCGRLDGIPLAIELAAAHANVLTPAQMLEHLSSHLDLLVDRRADKEARSRSLWATMEWSYQLLSPSLRRFFARLAVFHDGWTLEAAEAIWPAVGNEPAISPEVRRWLVIENLEQLCADSLLFTEECEDGLRFRMLSTLRNFACLRQSGEEKAEAAQRHADYFLAWIRRAEVGVATQDQALWVARLQLEEANLCAAMDWAAETGNARIELRLAAPMGWFWFGQGRLRQAKARLEAALSRPKAQVGTLERAGALNTAGTVAARLGDYAAARAHYTAALDIRRSLEDTAGVAATLNNLAIIAVEQGDYAAARAAHGESLQLWRAVDNAWGIAGALLNLGTLAWYDHEDTAARAYYEEAHALFQAQGNAAAAAMARMNLGGVACLQGEYEAAEDYAQESRRVFQEIGDLLNLADATILLGTIAYRQANYSLAHTFYGDGLRCASQVGHSQAAVAALEGMTLLALAVNRDERAARLAGAAEKLREEVDARPSPLYAESFQAGLAVLRGRLGETGFTSARDRGRRMTPAQVVEYAAHS
jgi:predicted ATPase/DNA-binding SARP family transcriptional activator